jgi:hypothetical protein
MVKEGTKNGFSSWHYLWLRFDEIHCLENYKHLYSYFIEVAKYKFINYTLFGYQIKS